MLTIALKSTDVQGKQNFIDRHIPFHTGAMPTLVNEEIDYIQADEDELLAIAENFTIGSVDPQLTIPMSNRRVVRWYGEMAKFIYYNIR